MKGKEKCRILKEIRAEIARANDIAWVTENCTHKGDCRGTCPKCEAEVRALERALERRRAMGKTVAVVGLSAGIIASSASCEALEAFRGNELAGDMVIEETTTDSSTSSTRTDVLTGDIILPLPGDVAVDGDMGLAFFFTDYTLLGDPIPYRATAPISLFPFDDIEYRELTIFTMPEGAEFAVVGESILEDGSVMVDYNDQLFRVDSGYEKLCKAWLPDPVE